MKKDENFSFDIGGIGEGLASTLYTSAAPSKKSEPQPPKAAAEVAAMERPPRPRPNPNRTRKPGSGKVSKALEEGRKALEETHYTQEETLAILGLCYNTFKKYLDAGYIKRIRYGRPHWVAKEDVAAFIEGVKNGTITQLPNK